MSHSLNEQLPPTRTDHPPSNFPTNSIHQHDFTNSNCLQSSLPHSNSDNTITTNFLCTICVDTPDNDYDQAIIPTCAHKFCIQCLASWSQVRQSCPNCKSLFSDVYVRRDLNGHCLQGPLTHDNQPPFIQLSLQDLKQVPWLQSQLAHVHSAQHDIEDSFSFPPIGDNGPPPMTPVEAAQAFAAYTQTSPAPAYVCEDVEDELESQFWQEEEQAHQRLMRTSRTVSNRRYGPTGYLSAGRMRATPRPNNNDNDNNNNGSTQNNIQGGKKKKKKNKQQTDNNKGTSSSSSASSSNVTDIGNATSSTASSSTTTTITERPKSGGRKKKLKKKSRAGIAAAKAAAEKADAEKAEAEKRAAEKSGAKSEKNDYHGGASSSTATTISDCGDAVRALTIHETSSTSSSTVDA